MNSLWQWVVLTFLSGAVASASAGGFFSPTAIAGDDDGVFLAGSQGGAILCLNPTNHQISRIPLALPVSGLALSQDGARLYVTSDGRQGEVCIVDVQRRRVLATVLAGRGAVAPVVNADGMTLYVCNRFEDDVSVIDLRRAGRAGGVPREMCRIPVGREPVAAAMTKDGKYLLVANELPEGRADVEFVAATVSVVDVRARRVDRVLPLPNGSCSLKDIAVSPDGRFAAVTHVIGRFKRTATSVVRGWMHVNAVTLIDLGRMRIRNTALLDDPDSGAADPWGVGWSADSRKLVVAHAGVDEVSVSDFPMLLEQLPELPAVDETVMKSAEAMRARIDGADNLPFLAGSRQRIKLSGTDRGPRALLVAGHRAYTANYFSGTLSVIDLDAPQLKAESIALGNEPEMDRVRKGEYYFNDGKLCYQGWQSCASCHPDGRADALNWDLLNDGVDNPKNTKSLLLAHQTGPSMTLGVRMNSEAAVRSGLQHILFTNATEEVAGSIDAYLKSLKPVPSPHLVRGRLAVAAKRGEKVFRSAGCADCHVPGLFTDLKPHDVGTRRAFDGPADRFYTPTLIEVWRTAPYLHDGSAATMREVLTTRNPTNEHGATKDLSEKELNDLCEYVLSL